MGYRIVLIGAGSAQFGLGTIGDILASEVLRGSTIVLHDINPTALDRVAATARAHIEERDLPFTVVATTDRGEALQGADYCVISIEVGDRFALWEQDWAIPLQYGVRQVYGENGGPGGLFHSLRIIPPILEICGDIERLCPDALVMSFSNPMSRICTTVAQRHPALRFIGLCHEVFSLPRHLPKILDTPWSNLAVRAGGLNHFSILLEATYRDTGRDAYPDIRAKAPAYFASLPDIRSLAAARASAQPGAEVVLPPATRQWSERGLFREFLERFDYLPVTTDSHFGEYIQWAHDVVDHKGILDFYSWYKRWCTSREARIGAQPSSERVVPIIEGIITDSGQEELAVNLPNDGLIDDLPKDIVVEVPAVVGAGGVHGVPLGRLPKAFAGLLQNQVAVHHLTAEAVLTRSRKAALHALLVDPVVTSLRAAEQLLDTMLEVQAEYLGYLE